MWTEREWAKLTWTSSAADETGFSGKQHGSQTTTRKHGSRSRVQGDILSPLITPWVHMIHAFTYTPTHVSVYTLDQWDE